MVIFYDVGSMAGIMMRGLENATRPEEKNLENLSEEEREKKEKEREKDHSAEGEQSEGMLKERALAIDTRMEELSIESIKERVRESSSGVSELDLERALAGKTSEEIKRIEDESKQVSAGVVTESLGYLAETFRNVPGSAKRVAEGIGSAAAHPVRTVHRTFDFIFTVLAGKIEDVFGYENLPEQQALEKIQSNFMGAHGSVAAELETMKKDPVGEGLALASIVTGGIGMAREAAGLAGKMGTIGKVVEQANGGVKAAEEFSRVPPIAKEVSGAGNVGKNLARIEKVLPDAEFPLETAGIPAIVANAEAVSYGGAIEKAGVLGAVAETGELELRAQKLRERQEVRSFSKRFAPFRRDELARDIRNLRKENRRKRSETNEKNEELSKEREVLSTDVESLERKRTELEKTVSEIEQSVNSDKSGLLFRIQNFFGKTDSESEKVLKGAQEELGHVRNAIEEKNHILAEMQDVLFEETHLEKARHTLEEFYHRQGDIKKMYESESEIRDIENISREHNALFLHAIPEGALFQGNTGGNNPEIKTGQGVSIEERIHLIRGIEPTISTSTWRNSGEKAGEYRGLYQAGVIIGGGRVMSAYRGDAATFTHGFFSKRAKYDENPLLKETSIQDNIKERIDNSLERPFPESPALGTRVLSEEAMGNSSKPVDIDGSGYAYGWNELVIENPKISGLYIREGFPFDPWKYVDLSEKLKVPLYLLGTEGGIRKWDESWLLSQDGFENWEFKDRMRESSLEEVMDSTSDISQEERLQMIEGLLEKGIFRGEKSSREIQSMKRALSTE